MRSVGACCVAGPVLTTNKYRSHDEQVPFSRAISTVLAVGDRRVGDRYMGDQVSPPSVETIQVLSPAFAQEG